MTTPEQAAQRVVVRKHKGRSGRSVYEWRVYRIDGSHSFQLAKYRTQEAAERAAEHYRANDERVRALWIARHNAELEAQS